MALAIDEVGRERGARIRERNARVASAGPVARQQRGRAQPRLGEIREERAQRLRLIELGTRAQDTQTGKIEALHGVRRRPLRRDRQRSSAQT